MASRPVLPHCRCMPCWQEPGVCAAARDLQDMALRLRSGTLHAGRPARPPPSPCLMTQKACPGSLRLPAAQHACGADGRAWSVPRKLSPRMRHMHACLREVPSALHSHIACTCWRLVHPPQCFILLDVSQGVTCWRMTCCAHAHLASSLASSPPHCFILLDVSQGVACWRMTCCAHAHLDSSLAGAAGAWANAGCAR